MVSNVREKVSLKAAIGERYWSSSSSDGEEEHDILDLEDDEGWEDVEPDLEKIEVISLFGDERFSDVGSMLQHCKDVHHFDIVKVQKDLNLEHLDLIKLVNYIRREVQEGRTAPHLSTKSAFQDEQYLIPTLKDDPLLYSLEEFVQDVSLCDDDTVTYSGLDTEELAQIKEVREQLQHTQQDLRASQERADFIQQLLDKKSLELEKMRHMMEFSRDAGASETDSQPTPFVPGGSRDSYADAGIHYDMLQDKTRTQGYQKFILENADLFKDKVVLDVGCGTGILSMFCAQAGAKKVIAVDESGIYYKAKQIIFDNGLQDTIQVLPGTIEKLTLPVDKVDIIVSEWMGYGLLFEGMLDSIIWARDHYLAPGGLMVPSHTTLRIAPLSSPGYVDERIYCWKNMYGFDMTAMLSQFDGEIDTLQSFTPQDILADSEQFLSLNLHTATIEDLSFKDIPFQITPKADGRLDGFLIWFDVFFLRPEEELKPDGVTAEVFAVQMEIASKTSRSFTTGPHGPKTHWRQGALLIDYGHRHKQRCEPFSLVKEQSIQGKIAYAKPADDRRGLNVDVKWSVDGTDESRAQRWYIR